MILDSGLLFWATLYIVWDYTYTMVISAANDSCGLKLQVCTSQALD